MESILSILLFSAGTIQGLLLIYILFSRPGKFIPNIILSLFVGSLILQVFTRFADIYFEVLNIGPLYDISYFLPYLFGPLTYLYVKKSIDVNPSFWFKELLHSIPFIISVLLVLVNGYGMIRIFSHINVHIYNIADTFVQLCLLVFYIHLSRKLLISSEVISGFGMLISWLKKLTIMVFITGVSSILLLTFYFYNRELRLIEFEYSVLIFAFHPLIIYWLSYQTITYPELFFDSGNTQSGQIKVSRVTKYQNNRLDENEITAITQRMESLMVSEKLYLEPEFSLDSLATRIGVPKNSVSRVINERMRRNFNDYINNYRIEYAKKELLDPLKKHLTIAAIAYESGFNSISTFNDTFRKFTGITPSNFKLNPSSSEKR